MSQHQVISDFSKTINYIFNNKEFLSPKYTAKSSSYLISSIIVKKLSELPFFKDKKIYKLTSQNCTKIRLSQEYFKQMSYCKDTSREVSWNYSTNYEIKPFSQDASINSVFLLNKFFIFMNLLESRNADAEIKKTPEYQLLKLLSIRSELIVLNSSLLKESFKEKNVYLEINLRSLTNSLINNNKYADAPVIAVIEEIIKKTEEIAKFLTPEGLEEEDLVVYQQNIVENAIFLLILTIGVSTTRTNSLLFRFFDTKDINLNNFKKYTGLLFNRGLFPRFLLEYCPILDSEENITRLDNYSKVVYMEIMDALDDKSKTIITPTEFEFSSLPSSVASEEISSEFLKKLTSILNTNETSYTSKSPAVEEPRIKTKEEDCLDEITPVFLRKSLDVPSQPDLILSSPEIRVESISITEAPVLLVTRED